MTSITNSANAILSDIRVSFCSESLWKPKQVYGPGMRLHYQLYVVTEGKGILQIGNEIYHLQKGDTIFVRPGTKIYLEADEYTPWSLAWTAFSGEESGPYLADSVYPDSPVWTCPDSGDQLFSYIRHLVEVFQREASRPMEITGALLQLLSYLLPSPKASIKRKDIKQYHLNRAKKYLEENYCYDLRIQDISHQLGIDRSYVYRLFIELEDKSPTEYLNDLRLKEACRMLEDEKTPIAEAAYSCGYADPESMTYHFRQSLGMTPDEYKWTHLRDNSNSSDT